MGKTYRRGSARRIAVAIPADALDRLGRHARRARRPELARRLAAVQLPLPARGPAPAAPRELEQLVVRQQLPRVIDERGQKPELERRQVDVPAVRANLPLGEVDLEQRIRVPL